MPYFDETTRAAAVEVVRRALEEDLQSAGDITSKAVVPVDLVAAGDFVFKEDAVVAGVGVVEVAMKEISTGLVLDIFRGDGERVRAGEAALAVHGPARAVLAAERTAINFLSHLCGIATLTRRFVDAVEGTGAKILDTRKTTPGLRILEKYAVRCGGGTNHRMGLWDQVLVKDNHLALMRRGGGSGGLADALAGIRERVGEDVKIEVEAKTISEVEAALAAHVDIIMLDNMTPGEMRAAVDTVRRAPGERPLVEASGGVTLETVARVAATGVDYVSVGALTHSAPAVDISLEVE